MKKYIGLLCIALMGVSCSDWLEEEPKSVAAETFYNTEAEAAAAVAAPLSTLNGNGGPDYHCTALNECFADYAYGRGSWESNSDYVGLDNTNQNRTSTTWTCFYRAIGLCNVALSRLPEAASMTEEQINAYMGELYFIRALSYFYLVRYWNDIPLHTVDNMDVYNIEKSPAADVYALIESDLQQAIANAPEQPRLVGTPTVNAARSLLGEVYATLGRYDEALPLLQAVIESGQYALVPVSSSADFDNVFGPDLVSSTEEIFYIKEERTTAGNEYAMFCAHPSAMVNGQPMHGAGGWYGIYTTTENQHDAQAPGGGSAACDYPLIRYPDVLLLYAEMAMRVSGAPTADAMEKVNMVHRRAYGYDPTTPSEVDFRLSDYATQEQFLDLILQERMYEQFNEGKRWFDLLRLGIVKEQIMKIKGIEVQDKHLLFPIPQTEFNYNEALDPATDQNPGY